MARDAVATVAVPHDYGHDPGRDPALLAVENGTGALLAVGFAVVARRLR